MFYPYFEDGTNVKIYYPDNEKYSSEMNIVAGKIVREAEQREIPGLKMRYMRLDSGKDKNKESVCVSNMYLLDTSIEFGGGVGSLENYAIRICAGIQEVKTNDWKYSKYSDGSGRQINCDYKKVFKHLMELSDKILSFPLKKFDPNRFVTEKIPATNFPTIYHISKEYNCLKEFEEKKEKRYNGMILGMLLQGGNKAGDEKHSYDFYGVRCELDYQNSGKDGYKNYVYEIRLSNLNHVYVAELDKFGKTVLVNAKEYDGSFKRPRFFVDRNINMDEIIRVF